MKRIFASILMLLLLLSACSESESLLSLQGASGTIAVIGDQPQQGKRLAQELSLWLAGWGETTQLGIGVTWRTPEQMDDAGRLLAIDSSVRDGAQVVICLGAAYNCAVYEAQMRHPETMFLLLDGEPQNAQDGVYESLTNTYSLRFSYTQAGFLAGYTAVMEGGRSLGFCGGSQSAEVLGYASGFLQGADYAAVELGLESGAVLLRFWCAGEEDTLAAAQIQLEQWGQERAPDLIFVCEDQGIKIMHMVAEKAMEFDATLIALSQEEEISGVNAVLQKTDAAAVQAALLALAENVGRWNPEQAGQSLLLGAAQGYQLQGVRDAWPFVQMSGDDWNRIAAQLESGEILVEGGSDWAPQSAEYRPPTES